MKLMVIGPGFFNYTSSLENAFKSLGCQTTTNEYRAFHDQCSYLQKKIDKWGLVPLSEQYYQDWNKNILDQVEAFAPDSIVILNGNYLSEPTLKKIKARKIKLILWLVDSILRFTQIEGVLGYYDLLYSFDPRDEIYIYQKYQQVCSYIPVGYDPEIYNPGSEQIRDIDICFVGNATGNRLAILKRVTEYAYSNNLKVSIYGKYWSDRYFWKKKRFAQKYWPLNLYIQNKTIDPHEVAALYRRSKICLNIHINIHEGVNPRTFEILGTKSMELVDLKPKLNEFFDVDKDLAVYENTDDLLSKIEYFLNNDELRNMIAKSGQAKVSGKYTIQKSVQTIFNSIKEGK